MMVNEAHIKIPSALTFCWWNVALLIPILLFSSHLISFHFIMYFILFHFILFYLISYDFILAAQSWAATVQSVCSRICVLFDVELA